MSNFNVYNQNSKGSIIKGWTKGVPVEDQALEQAKLCAQMPFIFKWIALMPDVHAGMGSTVGSVIPTQGAVMPSAVGVDIGCGMQALQVQGLTRNYLLGREDELLAALGRNIPNGRTDNGQENDVGRWKKTPEDIYDCWYRDFDFYYNDLLESYPNLHRGNKVTHEHLGTLGTGNHFCELAQDENEQVWIVLHSGSRGIGARIGNDFMRLAKDVNKKWFIDLPHNDLAYFPKETKEFDDYIEAVQFAQMYAKASRSIMVDNALKAIEQVLGENLEEEFRFDCHHNYVDIENHFGKNILVTRKGAVRAREKDWGIIPGSMGARSFIVKGNGCKDSFQSCSHGAGRKMSRMAAKKQFTLEDHKRDTEGVTCHKGAEVLDETPKAYKDIDAVMAAQTDLVDVVHTLKQFVCLKGVDPEEEKKKKKKQLTTA
jgi:tRNA-splicing ligase RtcB